MRLSQTVFVGQAFLKLLDYLGQLNHEDQLSLWKHV
eukprot:UN18742